MERFENVAHVLLFLPRRSVAPFANNFPWSHGKYHQRILWKFGPKPTGGILHHCLEIAETLYGNDIEVVASIRWIGILEKVSSRFHHGIAIDINDTGIIYLTDQDIVWLTSGVENAIESK